jgi:hypothetical protein
MGRGRRPLPSSFKNQTITTTKRETKMKKTLLALLSAVLLITVVQPAQAEDQKVLAIIDTAIDSSKFPQIIHEVCFNTYKNSCPNKTNFMEGKGAAAIATPPADSNNMSAYHGDAMVKAALAINPNLKIVFIRYAEEYTANKRVVYTNWADSLRKSIDWVSKNSEKYSIDALSISQSSINIPTWCTTDNVTINAVSLLNSKNVPVFAATGNDTNKTSVGFPACVAGVVGVGSLTEQVDAGVRIGETQTNRGPGLDLLAVGGLSITKVNGAQFNLGGTSGAAAISASAYTKNNTYKTFVEYLNSLTKESVKFVDYFTMLGKQKVPTFEAIRVVPVSSK